MKFEQPRKLLRRGKVAYLFELYTENQEMNGLVLCTPAHKQPETSAVVPVLDRWVRRAGRYRPRPRRTLGIAVGGDHVQCACHGHAAEAG